MADVSLLLNTSVIAIMRIILSTMPKPISTIIMSFTVCSVGRHCRRVHYHHDWCCSHITHHDHQQSARIVFIRGGAASFIIIIIIIKSSSSSLTIILVVIFTVSIMAVAMVIIIIMVTFTIIFIMPPLGVEYAVPGRRVERPEEPNNNVMRSSGGSSTIRK
ncbi:hypothetical protein AK812_SmicGene3607 [Symbiodinium microadriaticum]|uniref:Uncharacterized protein n=1 Tax=Symbiodinium microadriaticum TaxID=2951 RepID=A0A1Q9EYG7_SYMMI|nr:hypothetical protein AK812_SmicGene3607 [Symbiodinium microadriaticum]